MTNHTYNISEDQPLTVSAAAGLLQGTSEVEGDPLIVSDHTQPSNGTVTVQPIGSFTYVPDPNFNGQDSFSFVVSDGNGGYSTGLVTIYISECISWALICTGVA